MKKQKAIVKIEDLKKGNNSYYGNPSWYVYFTKLKEINGHKCLVGRYVAKTASNAQCGYTIDNYYNKLAEITYHITKTGNLIIDYVSEVK